MNSKIVEEIYNYAIFGMKIGLENMITICEKLGNPQNNYKIIHVAGTNGKGSTSSTIETILIENGNSVGKYTSPHILRINERIVCNGKEISNEDLEKHYLIVKKIINKYELKPSFFEVITCMMFSYFNEKKVEYVVLETGLGGKLDSTNIVNSQIAVITNVTMDHSDVLGNDIEEIVKQKLGIIKENSIVIIGEKREEILKNIDNYKKKKIVYAEDTYKNASYQLDYEKFKTLIKLNENDVEFSLFGDYQFKNFITAYAVLKELGIQDKIIISGAKKVIWNCRFEVIKREKTFILDGAHNVDGIEKLKSTLLKKYSYKDIVVITSILKDKEIEKMAPLIEEMSNEIILTSLSENKRGTDGEELKKYFNNRIIYIENDINKAYEKAINLKAKIIVICGSFYLLSKFKEKFEEKKGFMI